MDQWVLVGITLVVFILAGALMGVIAVIQIGGINRKLWQLRKDVGALTTRLDGQAPAATAASPAPAAAPAARSPIPATPARPARTRPAPPPPPKRPPRKPLDLEQSLTSKWMVWVGGLALALGGVFLVIYAIGEGYFGPGLRVGSGIALGIVLIAAGEWVRRYPAVPTRVGVGLDYVPQALCASGLVACFAAVYGAHALYGLIGVVPAFLALAVLAFAAIALAVLQGPFVAVLGLLGGYATPLLMPSDMANAWALFPYLFALTAACVFVVRFVTAWWLSWSALAGSAAWALLWLGPRLIGFTGSASVPEWLIPYGLYLIALTLLFQLVRSPAPEASRTAATVFARIRADVPLVLTWTASVIFAVLMIGLVDVANWRFEALIAMAALVAATIAFAVWEEAFAGLALLALATAAIAIGQWELAYALTWSPGQAIPPELAPFLGWCLAFALAFAGVGFWALWRAPAPGLWAFVAGAGPLAFLAIAYWRATEFDTQYAWSPIALVVGLLGVIATAHVGARGLAKQQDVAIGFFAAASVTAFSLALTMALQEAWLTVALSAELPVLAWIAKRRRIPALAPIAGGIAAVVLIRLIPNVYLLDYGLAGTLGIPWVVYGYGLPVLAFGLARGLFRDLTVWPGVKIFGVGLGDGIRAVLEAGAIAFAVILASFVIRLAMEGRIAAPTYSFAEQAVQQAAWATLAALLWTANRGAKLIVPAWAWRLLMVLAGLHMLVGPLLKSNPLWTGMPVGTTPVFNLLFIAYAVPAGFAFFFAYVWNREAAPLRAGASNIAGLGLAFVYLMLEVRRLYQGPVLSGPSVTDAELYTYSAALLVFALILLAIGLYRGQANARYASLAFMIATALKVFVIDTWELTGLYRVASFLGLGFALIALGWLYQRYVLPTRGPMGGGSTPATPNE